MFKVYKLVDGSPQEFEVFDIRYDSAGYPHFLLYIDNSWQVCSAKDFSPIVQTKTKGRKKKTLIESDSKYNFDVGM